MNKILQKLTYILVLLSFFCFPILFLLARRRRSSSVKRVLVVPQLTRIGDIVCSTPVFRAIKLAYPDAKLFVLTSRKVAGIVRHNPRIDEVVVVEDYKKEMWSLVRKIYRLNCTHAVSLSGTALSSMLFLWGAVPHRIKLVRKPRPLLEALSDWTATDTRWYPHHTHLPSFYLRLLEPLGVTQADVVKEVAVLPEERDTVAGLLAQHRVEPQEKLVGMSITAGNKIKEWGDDRFEMVARGLLQDETVRIVCIGSLQDKDRVDAWVRRLGHRAFSVTGLPLEALPALVERMKLFVAVDTGPIYIAHALHVPLVDIVGPVDYREQPPQDARSIQVRPPAPYTPSSFVFKKAGHPALHEASLRSISPDRVLRASRRLLTGETAFIFGATGLLGRALVQTLQKYGFTVVGTETRVDVSDRLAVQEALRMHSPHVVINAAAKIDVDWAETHEAEAQLVNAEGPRIILEAMHYLGMKSVFVHMSTSDVFGEGSGPWAPEALPIPVNVYGASKRRGEEHVLCFAPRFDVPYYIVRAGWLYGEGKRTFVDSFAQDVLARRRISAVSDQYNVPVHVSTLAEGIVELMEEKHPYGIYHLSDATGFAPSRYDIARFIIDSLGGSHSCLDKVYKKDIFRVKRPGGAFLKHSPEFGDVSWKEELRAYIKRHYGA